MAKHPAAGHTKTRLNPPFSYEQAAAFYECFLHDIIHSVRAVCQYLPDLTPAIAYAPLEEITYFQKLAPDFKLFAQQGKALGQRLDSVITDAFDQGFEQVAAMNSDSPTLPANYLVQGFTALDDSRTDLVLGPCEDGGYYFIGLKEPQPRLVLEVEMSTPNVLRDTLILAREEGLSFELLPAWYDVDTVDELERLHSELQQGFPQTASHTQQFLQSFKPQTLEA